MKKRKKRLPLSLWFKVRFTSNQLSDDEELLCVERASLDFFEKHFNRKIKSIETLKLLHTPEYEQKLRIYLTEFPLPMVMLKDFSDENLIFASKFHLREIYHFLLKEKKDDELLLKFLSHNENWKKIDPDFEFFETFVITPLLNGGFEKSLTYVLEQHSQQPRYLASSAAKQLLNSKLEKAKEVFLNSYKLDAKTIVNLFVSDFDENKLSQIIKNALFIDDDAFEVLVFQGNEENILAQLQKKPVRNISSYAQQTLLELNNNEITKLFVSKNILLTKAERLFFEQNNKELIVEYLNKGYDLFNPDLIFEICDKDIQLHYLKLYKMPYRMERHIIASKDMTVVKTHLLILKSSDGCLYEENEALLMEYIDLETFKDYIGWCEGLCDAAEITLMKKGNKEVANFYVELLSSPQNKALCLNAEYWFLLNCDVEMCISYLKKHQTTYHSSIKAILRRNEMKLIDFYAKNNEFSENAVSAMIDTKDKSIIQNLFSVPNIKINSFSARSIIKTNDIELIKLLINSGVLDDFHDGSIGDKASSIEKIEDEIFNLDDNIFREALKCYIEKYELCYASEIKLINKGDVELLKLYADRYEFSIEECAVQFAHLC